jgi:hypothetical protein
MLMVFVCGLTGGDCRIYTWVDRDGQVHFTDDYAIVPLEYRDRVISAQFSLGTASQLAPSGTSKKEKLSKSCCHLVPRPGGWRVAVLDGDTIIIGGGERSAMPVSTLQRPTTLTSYLSIAVRRPLKPTVVWWLARPSI